MDFERSNLRPGVFLLPLLAAIAMVVCCGCGNQGITGGSSGQLLSGDTPLGQMQVTAHQPTGTDYTPLGTGFTSSDGSFQLTTLDASGPLVLPAGRYRWTIESVGAEVRIPDAFKNAETSPLETQWQGDGTIELVAPPFKPLSVRHK